MEPKELMINPPMTAPTTPTRMLAMAPIWALRPMIMLASQPAMAPNIIHTRIFIFASRLYFDEVEAPVSKSDLDHVAWCLHMDHQRELYALHGHTPDERQTCNQ